MSIQVGIIRFGRIGAERAGWLAQASGMRPAVVFDPTPARRNLAVSRGLRAVDRIDAMLADPRPLRPRHSGANRSAHDVPAGCCPCKLSRRNCHRCSRRMRMGLLIPSALDHRFRAARWLCRTTYPATTTP